MIYDRTKRVSRENRTVHATNFIVITIYFYRRTIIYFEFFLTFRVFASSRDVHSILGRVTMSSFKRVYINITFFVRTRIPNNRSLKSHSNFPTRFEHTLSIHSSILFESQSNSGRRTKPPHPEDLAAQPRSENNNICFADSGNINIFSTFNLQQNATNS